MMRPVRVFQRSASRCIASLPIGGRACGILLIVIVGLTGCSDSPLAPAIDQPTAPRSLHATDVDCDNTADLRAAINAMEADGTLNAGRATALRSKLDQADRWEAEGDSDKAAEALQRLIEQVQAWVGEGALSAENAAGLLACAEDVADGPDVDFVYIDAGAEHTCALTTAGAAYCWGLNAVGQLGDGTNTDSNTPVAVSGGLSFVVISAGTAHTCGLTTTGAAYCWGRNAAGQLGDGTNTDSNTPVAAGGALSFADIDAGGLHTCGVTSGGDAYCWGENGPGALGDGTNTTSNTPMAVAAEPDLEFASISAGNVHTCALTTAGNAYCWGGNLTGRLGDGSNTDSNTPKVVLGGLSFAGISARSIHTCGMTTAGTAYCWGDNDWGELGDGTNIDSNTPVAVEGTLSFTHVDAGGIHTCGVTPAGNAYCWGGNDRGQLGDGTNTDSTSPVAVISP